MGGGKLTNKASMWLKNKTIEQAGPGVAIAKPCLDAVDMVKNVVEVPKKKVQRTPNEANKLNGIKHLNQKTNPNEANKSFVLGVPP
jgi:hypothetical protein